MSATDILRDALFGNPPNPAMKPSREGVLAAFSDLEVRATKAIEGATAGIIYYATGAARTADTSQKPGTLGKAADEPDYYRYTTTGWVVDNTVYAGIASVVQDQIDDANDASAAALALATTPRPATLSDTARKRILIAKGGVYENAGAGQVGAIKVSLPVGVDPRKVTIPIRIDDEFGSVSLTVGGTNNVGGWNFTSARADGVHSILLAYPNLIDVRFGNDGSRDCIWIGSTAYAFWQRLAVAILPGMTVSGATVNEAWMGEWAISLVTSIDPAQVTAGPIDPSMALSKPEFSFYVKPDTTRLALAVGQGARTGTAASNYNHTFGYNSGHALTTGFNNAFFGMEVGAAATTAQACTGMGAQALQYITTAQQATAFGIHALLNNTTGFANVAVGAGCLEYITTGEQNTAIGTYAGRGTPTGSHITGSRNIFIGQRAGLNIDTVINDELWVGSIPDAGGNVDSDALIRGDMAAKSIKINGRFAANGKTPVAATTLPAALPTDGTASNVAMATMLNAVRASLIATGLAA